MAIATFAPFNVVKDCRYGRMLFNQNDRYIGRSLDLYGEFSEGEVELFRQVIEPGWYVVEVGANIGAHTLFLARQVGPKGAVLAFEPQRIIFQALCANMALNSVPNVWCRQEAVAEQEGAVQVPALDYGRSYNFAGVELGSIDCGEMVSVVCLDSVKMSRCHFLKIDVEGMEESVLRGAVRTLARFKPLLYVENDRPEKEGSLIRFIASLDYVLYWHVPPLFNPRNFNANPDNAFGPLVSRNMFCVHRSIPQTITGLQPVAIPD